MSSLNFFNNYNSSNPNPFNPANLDAAAAKGLEEDPVDADVQHEIVKKEELDKEIHDQEVLNAQLQTDRKKVSNKVRQKKVGHRLNKV